MPPMGEKRHAKKIILLRKGNETTRKIEVFHGETFPGKTFVNMLGDPANLDRTGLYRLRIDGKWFPARQKMLYSKSELNKILTQFIGE
jgi:hypothetical protein